MNTRSTWAVIATLAMITIIAVAALNTLAPSQSTGQHWKPYKSYSKTQYDNRQAKGQVKAQPNQTYRATVTKVVDGDTIVTKIGSTQETIRYIGIDTPESVTPNTPVQCYAKAASQANANLVSGQAVRLVTDVEPRDRYGRILAYVYTIKNNLFINAELVAKGYAKAYKFPPNTKFASLFERLANTAHNSNKGLWNQC